MGKKINKLCLLRRNAYPRAVLHHGRHVVLGAVVERRVDLLEVLPLDSFDDAQVDGDVVVAVRSRLLVPEAERVTHLVNYQTHLPDVHEFIIKNKNYR